MLRNRSGKRSQKNGDILVDTHHGDDKNRSTFNAAMSHNYLCTYRRGSGQRVQSQSELLFKLRAILKVVDRRTGSSVFEDGLRAVGDVRGLLPWQRLPKAICQPSGSFRRWCWRCS